MKKTTPWEVSLLCWGCSSRIETIATLDGWETLCAAGEFQWICICCDFPPVPLRERGHKFDDHQEDTLHMGIFPDSEMPHTKLSNPSLPCPWMLEDNTNSEIITILILVLRTFYQAFDSNQFCQPSLKRTYIISNKEFWSIKRCINNDF